MDEILNSNTDEEIQGKTRRKKPKEGFLTKVNLENLKKELGMSTAEDIGVFVQLANPKNVYNWDKDQENHGTRPSWNAIVRMMQNGATVETLLGVQYNGRTVPAEVSNDPKFQAGWDKAHEEMKFSGLISDEVYKIIAKMKANGEL